MGEQELMAQGCTTPVQLHPLPSRPNLHDGHMTLIWHPHARGECEALPAKEKRLKCAPKASGLRPRIAKRRTIGARAARER